MLVSSEISEHQSLSELPDVYASAIHSSKLVGIVSDQKFDKKLSVIIILYNRLSIVVSTIMYFLIADDTLYYNGRKKAENFLQRKINVLLSKSEVIYIGKRLSVVDESKQKVNSLYIGLLARVASDFNAVRPFHNFLLMLILVNDLRHEEQVSKLFSVAQRLTICESVC